MSNRYGQVLKTLATTGDQPVLAAGSTLDDLLPGQVGFFSYPGDIAIDGTENHRNFYIGVGVDGDEVSYSGGQYIQCGNVKQVAYRPHTPAQEQCTVISDFCGSCDETYILSVQFENQAIFRTQGFVQFTKNYSFVSDCCSKCGCDCSCPTGDANKIAKGLWSTINADKDGLLIATFLDDADAPLADEAAIDAYIATQEAAEVAAAGTGLVGKLQLCGVASGIRNNCGLNLNYFYPRGTKFNVIGKAGFECNLTVENIQEVAFVEGAGHDILHREMIHATNNPGADSWYYTSPSTSLPTSFPTMADESVNYNQFAIETDHTTSSAWLEYNNAVGTILAVPASDMATATGIATVLDALVGDTCIGFDEISSDVAASIVDETIVEPTTDKGEGDDGLTS